MTYASGPDISTWQSSVPTKPAAFTICRATYGRYKDSKYDAFSATVLSRGQVLGAYAFAVPTSKYSLTSQVDAILAVAGNAAFLVIDLESDGADGTMTNADARNWIASVRSRDTQHRQIGLYHSLSGYTDLGQDFNWVAKWSSTPPSITWRFWQYTSRWNGVDGSAGDGNFYHGTAADLKNWLAGGVINAPNIPEPTGDFAMHYTNQRGTHLAGDKKLSIPAGSPIMDGLGKTLFVTTAAQKFPLIGNVDGSSTLYEVRAFLKQPYDDGQQRPTSAFVKSTDAAMITEAWSEAAGQ